MEPTPLSTTELLVRRNELMVIRYRVDLAAQGALVVELSASLQEAQAVEAVTQLRELAHALESSWNLRAFEPDARVEILRASAQLRAAAAEASAMDVESLRVAIAAYALFCDAVEEYLRLRPG